MVYDIIELRLPLKSEYLPVLRTTTGVVAGSQSFGYDQIMQLRVAVTEVFDLAMDRLARAGQGATENELAVRFMMEPDKLEIMIAGPESYVVPPDSEEGKKSLALLKSLTDAVEFGIEAAGRTGVRMVKYKSTGEA